MAVNASGDGWTIANAEELLQREDGVYWIPDADIRNALRPGDHAKVVFRGHDQRLGDECIERMWVQTAEGGVTGYRGVLDNKPACEFGLKLGDEVRFGSENIVDVRRREDEHPISELEDLIFCDRHGPSIPSYVCAHIARGRGVGFNTAANAEERRPDAWCDRCDDLLDPEMGWDALGDRHPEIVAVCAGCYDSVRARNISS